MARPPTRLPSLVEGGEKAARVLRPPLSLVSTTPHAPVSSLTSSLLAQVSSAATRCVMSLSHRSSAASCTVCDMMCTSLLGGLNSRALVKTRLTSAHTCRGSVDKGAMQGAAALEKGRVERASWCATWARAPTY